MKLLKTPSRSALSIAVGSLVLVATSIFASHFANARSDDETTAIMVANMIDRFHISQQSINDETSTELVRTLLDDLDPAKLYFNQKDIDYFHKFDKKLDDQLKAGDVSFIDVVFKVYQTRLNERVKLAHKLIDQEHDFTIDESIVVDADSLTWPKSDQEINDRWRKRIKADLLSKKLEEVDDAEARESLHKRYRMIQKTISQTEQHEKLEIYLTALAKTFDPHSSYMSPETVEDFGIIMRLSLEGIGAQLRSEDGYVTVASVVKGGAADKDGRLKPGDVIIAVGQETGDFVDVVEMKLSKVVRYIRGDRGTKVRLKVKTVDDEVVVYTLTRQKIELQDDAVRGEIIKTEDRISGASARVGVINIPSFYRDFQGAQLGKKDFKSTTRDVRKVLQQFDQQGGVDAVIIDLRFDGGGALTEAIDVSGLFIDRGPIVQVKNLDGSVRTHDDEDKGVAYSGPLVVVVNKLSASASEIFAGAIKDYGRGIVVGDASTHGKGTVQNVMPVSRRMFSVNNKDRGALKLTINQFYRVNGDSTQNLGVRSDVVLPSLLDHMDLGEASLDNALEFDQVKPAEYRPYNMVSPQILKAVREASAGRVKADPEWQKEQRQIDRYLEKKNRKLLSLNLLTRLAEKAADEKDKDEDEDEEKADDSDKPIFEEGFYNDELLSITVDYLKGLKGGAVVGRQ